MAWRPLLVVAAFGAPSATLGAPNEIKVFTDELAGYAEHTLETHVNKASRAGAANPNRLTPLQVMPEYSYGLWRNWEFSLQLPSAMTRDSARLEGARVELQYVAPHDVEKGFYWGVNLELARIARMGEPAFWNVEAIPILGYRTQRWHFVANAGVDRAVTGNSRSLDFSPAAKLAYLASGRNYVGLEYFVEAGPVRRALPKGEQSRVLYLAWDGKIGASDINVGVGRGFTDSSDRWVFKMVYEFSF